MVSGEGLGGFGQSQQSQVRFRVTEEVLDKVPGGFVWCPVGFGDSGQVQWGSGEGSKKIGEASGAEPGQVQQGSRARFRTICKNMKRCRCWGYKQSLFSHSCASPSMLARYHSLNTFQKIQYWLQSHQYDMALFALVYVNVSHARIGYFVFCEVL